MGAEVGRNGSFYSPGSINFMNSSTLLSNRFQINHGLMKDSSGQILLARDLATRADVFIRIAPDGPVGGLELSAWFQGECERASRIQHPNLCRVIETFSASEMGPFLVSEGSAGVNLRNLVALGLPLAISLRILVHCSRGLIAAKKAGVLPLRLSAEQVLVTQAGMVKVAIFGGHDREKLGEVPLSTVFAPLAFELSSYQFERGPVMERPRPSPGESGGTNGFLTPMVLVFQRAFAQDQHARPPSLRRVMDMLIAESSLPEDQRVELLDLMASERTLDGDPLIAAVVPPDPQNGECFSLKDSGPSPSVSLAGGGDSPAPRSRRPWLVLGAAVVGVTLALAGGVALLRPAPITLQIDPTGAEVRVDGRWLGKAPLGPTRDIKPGMVVQAEFNGYLTTRYTVKDGDARLNLKLDPIPPPPPEPKVPDTPEPVAEPSPDPVPSSKAPKPKAKPKQKAAPAPKDKKPDVFDQIRKQM